MAKRVKQTRQPVTRKTNWAVIGGVIGVGVIALFALLFLSMQEPELPTLDKYCAANPDRCMVRGNPAAPVTIVEISDYGCGHCRNFHVDTLPLLLAQYVETNQVRWITLPYALSSTTLPATNAAMCANEQDAYYEYAELLFRQQGSPIAFTLEGYTQAAQQLNLNMDSFNRCVSEGRYVNLIQENRNAARAVGVNATPTFFINGRMLEGNQPYAVFQQRISSASN